MRCRDGVEVRGGCGGDSISNPLEVELASALFSGAMPVLNPTIFSKMMRQQVYNLERLAAVAHHVQFTVRVVQRAMPELFLMVC